MFLCWGMILKAGIDLCWGTV